MGRGKAGLGLRTLTGLRAGLESPQLLTARLSPALSQGLALGTSSAGLQTLCKEQRPSTWEQRTKILGISRSTMPQTVEAKLTSQTTVQGGPAASKAAASSKSTNAQ